MHHYQLYIMNSEHQLNIVEASVASNPFSLHIEPKLH